MVAAQRGYRCVFVMPDKMSREKIALLRAFGAEVVVCPTNVEPDDARSYYSVSDRLADEIPGAWKPNQYENPANPAAHEATTGPEIWAQLGEELDVLVAGVGTGGTITGVRASCAASCPGWRSWAPIPEGSIYSSPDIHPYLVEGVGEDFWPTTYDPSLVDRYVTVSDRDSFWAARRMAREEGILIGGSGGLAPARGGRGGAVAAARSDGARDPARRRAAVPVEDLRRRLDDRARHAGADRNRADGRQILRSKADETADTPAFVAVGTHQRVGEAIDLLQRYGISQMPVVRHTNGDPLDLGSLVGSIHERDLLERVFRDGDAARRGGRDRDGPAARRGPVGAERRRRLRGPPGSSRGRGRRRVGADRRAHPLGPARVSRPCPPSVGGPGCSSRRARSTPAGARGRHGVGQRADLPDLDLRAGRRRRDAGRPRLRPHDQPDEDALQACLAALDGGRHGVAFASGMAATSAVLGTFPSGSRVLAINDVYGGTYRLFSKVLEPQGYRFAYADISDPAVVERELAAGVDLVWVETPTNPLLKIVDIAMVAERAHAAGAAVVVDSTFASPYLQTPLALGADVVVHSTTKYIGGHSDVVGGVAVTDDDGRAEQLRFLQNAIGAVPAPLDCFLTLRGRRRSPSGCASTARTPVASSST
jgi:CBS domain-containing protein